MLLTWMAFRGKFPRAEPLHFLDEDLGPTTPPAEEFQPNVRVARDPTRGSQNLGFAWVHFGLGILRQRDAGLPDSRLSCNPTLVVVS
jgi:hypothetical protein